MAKIKEAMMDAEYKHESGQEHDSYWCKHCKQEKLEQDQAMKDGLESALKEMKEKIYSFMMTVIVTNKGSYFAEEHQLYQELEDWITSNLRPFI